MSCQFHHPSLVNCRHCVFWWVAAHVFVSVAGCPPPLACDAFHWSRDQHSCIVAYEPTSVKDKVTCIMIRYIFAACSTFHGIIIIINIKMEIEYGSGHAFFDWLCISTRTSILCDYSLHEIRLRGYKQREILRGELLAIYYYRQIIWTILKLHALSHIYLRIRLQKYNEFRRWYVKVYHCRPYLILTTRQHWHTQESESYSI